ncbi:MAG TPA: hypothetical protein VIN59_09260 [Alphaproteobacteria bacterium]
MGALEDILGGKQKGLSQASVMSRNGGELAAQALGLSAQRPAPKKAPGGPGGMS